MNLKCTLFFVTCLHIHPPNQSSVSNVWPVGPPSHIRSHTCKVLLKIMSSLKKTLPRKADLALENRQKFRDVRKRFHLLPIWYFYLFFFKIGISLSKKSFFFFCLGPSIVLPLLKNAMINEGEKSFLWGYDFTPILVK